MPIEQTGHAMDIYQQIAERQRQGKPTVVMTLVKVQGTAPRRPGAKMVIGRKGIVVGTLGGGAFEEQMVARAAEIMAKGRATLLEYEDQPDNDLACGGRYTVFAEPLTCPKRLFLLGSGHVGSALARLAETCGYQVLIFDDRPAPDNTTFQYVQLNDYEDPFTAFAPCPGDALVIAGRSHEIDLQSLRAALRASFSFIGLLGSTRKRDQFFAILTDEGVPADLLKQVHTPVGLDIGARTPEEIAVAIMAQLIAHHRQAHAS